MSVVGACGENQIFLSFFLFFFACYPTTCIQETKKFQNIVKNEVLETILNILYYLSSIIFY